MRLFLYYSELGDPKEEMSMGMVSFLFICMFNRYVLSMCITLLVHHNVTDMRFVDSTTDLLRWVRSSMFS